PLIAPLYFYPPATAATGTPVAAATCPVAGSHRSRATSLARAAHHPPGLQPGERVVEAVGHRNRRTGRSERRMGIALDGCQTAAGRFEFERVAPPLMAMMSGTPGRTPMPLRIEAS